MVKLLLIGPLGLGHHIRVEDMPTEDSGSFCKSYKRTVVWDAALVSLFSGKTFGCSFVSNKIGNFSDSLEIRRILQANNVSHAEVGTNPVHMPSDFIISTSTSSTRTWFSAITPPSYQELGEFISAYSDEFDVLYSDHWMQMADFACYVQLIKDKGAHAIWYNVGDWEDISQIPFICSQFDATNTVIQLSLKSTVETSLLTSLFSAFEVPQPVRLVITRGENEIIVKTAKDLRVLPVRRVNATETTGAGAYFAAEFLRRMIGERTSLPDGDSLFELIVQARDAATGHIENDSNPIGTLDWR
jgi:hypothetical protein